jgi:hypothetical protein
MTVPRVFHFVFGLRLQTEAFHLAHYLCLESCRRVNSPDRILFHYHHEPHGPLWDLIRPELELRQIEPEGFVRGHPGYLEHDEGKFIQGWDLDYAHQADFIRLRVLGEHGGVYADMDTLFVRPLPDEYYAVRFLIGEEDLSGVEIVGPHVRSLCNAVMVSEVGSPFAAHWLERMYEVFDGTWSRHSCQEATELAETRANEVTVVGPTAHFNFPCTASGLRQMFEESWPLPRDLLSMHLWAHTWWSRLRTDFTGFHAGDLTEEYVRRGDTTYANAARRFLP